MQPLLSHMMAEHLYAFHLSSQMPDSVSKSIEGVVVPMHLCMHGVHDQESHTTV